MQIVTSPYVVLAFDSDAMDATPLAVQLHDSLESATLSLFLTPQYVSESNPWGVERFRCLGAKVKDGEYVQMTDMIPIDYWTGRPQVPDDLN